MARKTLARSLELCKRRGWPARKVEQWIPSHDTRRLQDLGAFLEARLGRMDEAELGRLLEWASTGVLSSGRGPADLSRALDERLSCSLAGPGILPPHQQQRLNPGVRVDLFGLADVEALDGLPGVLWIQSTSGGGDPSGHIRRYQEDEEKLATLTRFLDAGNRFQIWGWRKVRAKLKSGKPGKATRWQAREIAIEIDSPGFLGSRERKD